MGLPICLEIHRFIEPTIVDTVGADIIRPENVPLSIAGKIMEQGILQISEHYENVSIDKLSYLTNIRIEDLLPILLMLEFQNYVVCLPGNRYQIK